MNPSGEQEAGMDQEELLRGVRILVEGRVQGVGFRYWVKHQALRHNLTGWVRNRVDGDVELYAQGTPSALQTLIDRCYEGPPTARVLSVNTVWRDQLEEFSEFSIRI